MLHIWERTIYQDCNAKQCMTIRFGKNERVLDSSGEVIVSNRFPNLLEFIYAIKFTQIYLTGC
jgi:hypothetical protein